MTTKPKRLYRSATDTMVSGVAAGIAEYIDIDPTLMRIAWVVLILVSGGLALIAYIALAIIMPKAESAEVLPEDAPSDGDAPVPQAPTERGSNRFRNPGVFAGVILIAIGLPFLLSGLGFLGWWRWETMWPIVLILIGAAFLVGSYTRR